MTAEQLQNARLSAWRQAGNALLTAEDAAAWLREAGLTLFLPRSQQIAAPAGSFVEATLGAANSTPRPDAIENASGLLRRLLASGDVLALNLLGIPGDQPDFLASEDTLPFLYALRGDREWKRGPRGKSSPLVLEVWKLLDREGALSAEEIKDQLGRHLTEAAALRALTELWSTLRIEPVYAEAEGTRWQLLEANHEKAMTAGSAMAQGMALSALVSLYLQSAVAATGDEIEAFLSPVASRSRIREAVRGLTATRQLSIRHLGAHEHFYVEGSLPALTDPQPEPRSESRPRSETVRAIPDLLPEVAAPADLVVGAFRIEALSEAETEQERTVGDGRKRFVARRTSEGSDRKGFGPRTGAASGPRSGTGMGPRPGPRPGSRPGKSFGERKSFGSKPPRPEGGSEGAKPFFAREPWKEDRRPLAVDGSGATGATGAFEREPGAREAGDGSRSDRRPFRPAAGGGKPKPFGAGRPPRRDGERTGASARPANTANGAARGGFVPREGSDRKPFAAKPFAAKPFREGGEKRPFAPRGDRPGSAAGERKPFTPRPSGDAPAGEGRRKTFGPRAGGDRKAFTPRGEGTERPASRPYTAGSPAREGGTRPFSPRGDAPARPYPSRPFKERSDRPDAGGPGTPDGEARRPFKPRRAGGDARPFSPRPFSPRPGGRPASGEAGRGFGRSRDEGGSAPPRRTGAAGAAPKRFASDGDRPARPGASAGAGSPIRPSGKKPRTTPFTSSGKPRAGVAATGRPGPKAARPGARPGKPASGRKPGAPPRGPGGGPRKPGGKGPRRSG